MRGPPGVSQSIFARHALLPDGWRRDVRIDIDDRGCIAAVETDGTGGEPVGVLLPSPANLHSHSFQRAMAGLTEARGPGGRDSFWTWRALMYRFLESLAPDDFETIAAMAQVEMLEAGYASVGEFHYVHHQPGGAAYARPAELSHRLLAAAVQTGIGYTHLPVLYMQGGLDGRSLEGGQLRFGCNLDRFVALHSDIEQELAHCPADFRLGVAPHSLRAVTPEGIAFAETLAAPIHIHIAEQVAEVDAVVEATGQRPVEWLLDHAEVDDRWCLVHATHATASESSALAKSGAVAGLCPITEANLGDGIFPAPAYLAAGGRFGIGTDSNVQIALAAELRLLEYGQRLAQQARAVIASGGRSAGRVLLEESARGGARALGRNAGSIERGQLADLVALNDHALALAGLEGDRLLDAWIFANTEKVVTDVWSAGRHMVRAGRHIRRDEIERRFRPLIERLRAT
jgi:formimidoylglutamate deiminase